MAVEMSSKMISVTHNLEKSLSLSVDGSDQISQVFQRTSRGLRRKKSRHTAANLEEARFLHKRYS